MPASPCITYISNDDLRKIVSQIDAEKLNQIGQEFLDVTPTDLQNYLFSAKGDVELYKFKILESWRNKNDGPDARQNLYEILLEASEKQLIDPECLNPEWFLTDPTENRTEHGQDKSNDDNANEVKSHRKHSSDSSSAKLLLSVAVQALVIVLAIFTLPDFHHIEGPVLVVVGGSLYPEKGERLTSNAVNVYSLNNGQITWSHQGKYTPIGWTDAGGTTYNGRLYISGMCRFTCFVIELICFISHIFYKNVVPTFMHRNPLCLSTRGIILRQVIRVIRKCTLPVRNVTWMSANRCHLQKCHLGLH